MPDECRFSEVESRRFGKRIARATVTSLEALDALDRFAAAERIDMAIARCPVNAPAVAQAMEARGHRLMDVLVYYEGATNVFSVSSSKHTIRTATAADRDGLAAAANDAFTGYDGHYHADPRLDPALATAGYVEWGLGLLESPAHVTHLAVFGDSIMGFISVKRNSQLGEITLNGVARGFQRQGVYDSLIKAAGHALHDEGTPRVRVSTHLANVPPQRVWVRHGLMLDEAVYTFHKWYR